MRMLLLLALLLPLHANGAESYGDFPDVVHADEPRPEWLDPLKAWIARTNR